MSWVSAIPDVLVCVGLFFVPGLLVTYLGGLRGITAWAMAPLMTVAAVAGVAVLGGLLGFRFGVWPVAAGVVVMAGLAAGLSLLLRARGIERPARDPRSYSLAVVAGAVAAAVIGAVTFVTGVSRPDAISQTWDAIFHYNAVRYIEQTGKASPLTIGTLGQPGGGGTFYPDAWHAMAALLGELTGASIPVAATVTCLVVAVLVWPLSCLLLARHLFGASGGRAAAAVVITGMLSSLFAEFPWNLTGWGVLWPNALGLALAPAGVAAGLSVTRVSEGDTFGPVRRWLFGAAAAWAIAIAHPISALSVALICLFPLLMVVGPYLAGQWRRHPVPTTLIVLATVAVVAIGLSVPSGLGLLHSVETQYFPLIQSPRQAVVGAISNGTDRMAPEWMLAVFMVIGAIACFAWRQRRWLVVAELVIAGLYVGAAAIGSPISRLFTGPWYNDSHRLAAILPIVAIPLATSGVLAVAEVLRRVAFQSADVAQPAVVLALSLIVGAAVAGMTAVHAISGNAGNLGGEFSSSGSEIFVSPAKLQFLRKVADIVPTSSVVADSPYSGTAYLYALSGIRVLFPQISEATDNHDMVYLALNLTRIGQDPRACDLVRRYGVGYMIIAPDNYLRNEKLSNYPGVADPGPGPGFQLVAADGPQKLYKITMCQPPSRSAGSVEAARPGAG